MQADKLITMANQIGTFFTRQGPGEAAAGTANHLKKFWDPRMRAAIIAHLHAGGEGLRPEVLVAVQTLAREAGTPVVAAAPAELATGKEQPKTPEAGAAAAAAASRPGFISRLLGRRL
jgi:formate dehydrogenase subunit delta